MLPLEHSPAWRNLRPCLHKVQIATSINGRHKQHLVLHNPITPEGDDEIHKTRWLLIATTHDKRNLQIREFHGLLKLDNNEVARLIKPEDLTKPQVKIAAGIDVRNQQHLVLHHPITSKGDDEIHKTRWVQIATTKDNAEEFLMGKLKDICTQKGINQTQSASY